MLVAKHTQDNFIGDPSLDDLNDPRFVFLLELWREKRGDRRMPSRADFHPSEFSHLLPNIVLGDVLSDPPDIIPRVVGAQIDGAIGRGTTGVSFRSLPGTEVLLGRIAWMGEHRKPYFQSDMTIPWGSRKYKIYSGLGLPLSSDGKTVNKLLGLMLFR